MRNFFVLVLLAAPIPLLAGDSRLPVPDQAKLSESEKLVRDLFKVDYAKSAAVDRQALAQRLFQQATETKDDPAARFVLLKQASDLATQVGDTETKDFVIDGGEQKLAALPKLEVLSV